MKWNTDGHYGRYVPQELKDLPLELKRSHRYPRNPEEITTAMQEYLDGKPKPEYLPQGMAFQRWKAPPWKAAWLSGTIALMQARQNEARRLARLTGAGMEHVPVAPIDQQAQEYEQMPMPLDEVNPALTHPRGAVKPGEKLLSADDMRRLGRDYDKRMYQNGEGLAGRTMDALQQVKSQAAQLEDFVSAPEQGAPWFKRGIV
jgi:hypothetical protein